MPGRCTFERGGFVTMTLIYALHVAIVQARADYKHSVKRAFSTLHSTPFFCISQASGNCNAIKMP